MNKKILSVLRQKTPRNIILYILVCNGASQIELSKELEKDPKTIEFHLKKLQNSDIIRSAPVKEGVIYTMYEKSKIIESDLTGREIIYILKDPCLIYKLLIVYRKKMLDGGVTDNTLDFFKSFFLDKPVERVGRNKDNIDRVIAMLSEIFPHPYCA